MGYADRVPNRKVLSEHHRIPRGVPILGSTDCHLAVAVLADIISAQHFWTGGLETAGPGCYDAVAIARAAGFRMLVTSRIRHAAIVP